MQQLNNKTILITGASSGIGAACAMLFAQQGAKLILVARRQEKLNAMVTSIIAEYPQTQIQTYCLDVRDRAAVQQGLANINNVDILINNAGLAAGLDKIQEANIDDWEQMIDTNVKGLLYVTRAILPGMLARNQGHIVNIGSIAGHLAYSGGSVYCGTKAAVRSISQAMRQDVLGSSIRVSQIDPGMVETEFSLVRFKGNTEKADKVYQGIQPLTPYDVADTILYCVTRPAHVDIAEIILFPTAQAGLSVHRNEGAIPAAFFEPLPNDIIDGFNGKES